MELPIKTRETGIQAQQARETGAPWTGTSVYERWNVLLRLLYRIFDIRIT